MLRLEIVDKDNNVKVIICSDVAISGDHLFYTPFLEVQFKNIALADIRNVYINQKDD